MQIGTFWWQKKTHAIDALFAVISCLLKALCAFINPAAISFTSVIDSFTASYLLNCITKECADDDSNEPNISCKQECRNSLDSIYDR